MSVNCNRIAQLHQSQLEEKSALGRRASMAVHGALSHCYRAIETLEASGAATGAEGVYLTAATSKLDTAADALRGMRDILLTGKPSEAGFAWLDALDYDRLYEVGRKRNLIPAGTEQWACFVKLMKSRDHLAVTSYLITAVEGLQKEIQATFDSLARGRGAPISEEQVERVWALQAALIEFSVFAQMVAYVNVIEPMDRTWCRPAVGPALRAQ